ncbi:hypothetical protein GWI33_001501, partial [Rhynchophorus ferrugineus]
MKLITCFLWAVYFLAENDAASILGIFPFPGSSHYVMFKEVMIGLARRGHEVDVVTHFPSTESVP